MAAVLKRELDLDTKLVPGGVGEFTIWVRGKKIAEKDFNGFPGESDILKRAEQALH